MNVKNSQSPSAAGYLATVLLQWQDIDIFPSDFKFV